MKAILFALLGVLLFANQSIAQNYFSDIIKSDFDKQFKEGNTNISVNYWRFDTCLYSSNMCKFNSATAVGVKIIRIDDIEKCYLAFSSQKRYLNELADNTFEYSFSTDSEDKLLLIRKLILERKENNIWKTYMRIDSFPLQLADAFLFSDRKAIRKVFGKTEADNQKSLKVYVFKSVDFYGSAMFHFWVERMGVIKLTDEKCWRYSFEMLDTRTTSIRKLFIKLYSLIKTKYKDPYWVGKECSFE